MILLHPYCRDYEWFMIRHDKDLYQHNQDFMEGNKSFCSLLMFWLENGNSKDKNYRAFWSYHWEDLVLIHTFSTNGRWWFGGFKYFLCSPLPAKMIQYFFMGFNVYDQCRFWVRTLVWVTISLLMSFLTFFHWFLWELLIRDSCSSVDCLLARGWWACCLFDGKITSWWCLIVWWFCDASRWVSWTEKRSDFDLAKFGSVEQEERDRKVLASAQRTSVWSWMRWSSTWRMKSGATPANWLNY